MQVIHFNYSLHGGASVAALRLHRSLRSFGINSQFQCSSLDVDNISYRSLGDWLGKSGVLRARLFGKINRVLDGYRRSRSVRHFFTHPILAHPTKYIVPNKGQVILHLHWISELIDYPTFFENLNPSQPVIWTLHDLNPMTGGCHYTGGCNNFVRNCGHCPQLVYPKANDVSAMNHSVKMRSVRRLKNLHIAGDSNWTTQLARASSIFSSARSIQTIHYGLDTCIFQPLDRSVCRKRLGIPEKSFVICAGAHRLDDKRKGCLELRQALIASPELRDAVLLVFGESKGPFSDLPQKVVTAGFSSEESVLAQVYGASDVFAMPSLEEAFGQTALEAMACGIPVVGFRTGGIPDTVNHEVTGLLGPVGDVLELGKMLTRIRNHPEERFRMGEASRARVEKHFTLERQRQDYLEIYEQALQKISHD